MNWVLLACFLIALAASIAGLAVVGREMLRLNRATREAQRQVTPRVEAIMAGQEQAMILADRIAQRQAVMAESLAETSASLSTLGGLAGDLLDAQEDLVGLGMN